MVVLTPEDGTDRLSRNVGTELPLDAAWYPRRAQVSRSNADWMDNSIIEALDFVNRHALEQRFGDTIGMGIVTGLNPEENVFWTSGTKENLF